MFDSLDTLERDLLQFANERFRLPEAFNLVSNEVGKAVIQLAAGKSVDYLDGAHALDTAQVAARREAATRFVSGIMLAESSNYFMTLGVSPDVDSSTVRDNFRRLMALVHPDAHPVGFPPDAASRVNRAYAVLSEAGSRAAYAARELGVSPFGSVVFNAEPTARRSHSTTLEVNKCKPAGRFYGWLQTLRARQSLLWVAALLLLPLGAAVISFFSYEPPRQLVVVQPKVDLPAAKQPSAATSFRSVDTADSPKTGPEERVATVAGTVRENAAKQLPLPKALSELVADSHPAQKSSLSLPTQLKISVELEQNAANVATTAVTPPRRTAPTASADAPAIAGVRPASSLAPIEPTRDIATDVSPVSALTVFANTVAQPALSQRLATADAEAMVIRFSNAYEAGSISAFGQLFAPAMGGRRQMLNDYERVFLSTRLRTIKFNQLKHSMSGERLATSGYAVVTTTDQENRIMTQRVFLEFEIGRDRGEPRIERLANYVIN